MRLNREIKAFCADFGPVREVLQAMGAEMVRQIDQHDSFFCLPKSGDPNGRRLKLRTNDGRPELIYYYDRNEVDSRVVEFQVADIQDARVKEVLEAALGVRTIVKKQHEVWKKGAMTFNLDTVHDVGKIFEVEIEVSDEKGWGDLIAQCRELFGPHLGPDIVGSNEDLTSRSDAGEQRHQI